MAGEAPLIRSTVGVLDHAESQASLLAHSRPVIAIGVSSKVAVLHTVLAARRLGHPVHVIVDLCGSRSERAEQAALRQMEQAGATLSAVASLLTGLIPNLDDPRAETVALCGIIVTARPDARTCLDGVPTRARIDFARDDPPRPNPPTWRGRRQTSAPRARRLNWAGEQPAQRLNALEKATSEA